MFTFQTKISLLKALVTKNSPFYVQFYISKSCHLQCKMCNIVEANADLSPIKLDDIGRMADNLVKIGAGVILLTGGEPFLRADIDEAVRIFKSRGLDVRLQTAGLYAQREKIAHCVSNGARDINVSLDSLDEELSDYINGAKGSWKSAIKTISFISQTFPRKDSLCALGCVLSPYNIDEIEAVLDFATQIGWWLSLVPAHITSPNEPMNFRGCDEYFKFRQTDLPKVKSLIERLKGKKNLGFNLFDSNRYLDSIVHFITYGTPNWRHKDVCDSPDLYFAILPDGQFAPCCDFRLKDALYVYDADFPRVYQSMDFRQKVKEITRRCPGCNFGSFPEVSLSVRDPLAIFERAGVYFKTKTKGIKSLKEEELFDLITAIRDKYPVYKQERNLKFRDNKKGL